ncbi:MAG TPA: aminotransferase class IV [Mesotoga sp.]|jgi:branched-chain amino acid aminotransferase|nr:aminotransferase class IV [Mesotoga sp.]MDI9376285.1 aminotransferase class IV [Thermotogota bacterium]NLX34169.1 aminotransferase class IV [Thermotogaceae bacterium]MDD4041120.1 aminotransferase class IV [Mesotoga sp.]MDD4478460.1 aminotransferase class IV [Mesotoga sp.]
MLNYIAGQWYDENDSLVSALIPGVLNCESVYEVVRTYNGLPFAFRKHFDRLKQSAGLMSIEVPFTCKELNSVILEGIDKNRLSQSGDFRIRIVLFGGGEGVLPAVIYTQLPSVSKDIYELGVKIAISPYTKPSGAIVDPRLKIPGASWNIRTRKNLGDNYDMIILNEKGNVCEGSFSNVFLLKDGQVITPDIGSGVLPGITRDNLIGLCSSIEINVMERPVASWEMFSADELFLTHTSVGIVPIRKLEEKILIEDFTDGMTRLLLDNFEGYIMTEDSNWSGLDEVEPSDFRADI